jgi:hypothetical protein
LAQAFSPFVFFVQMAGLQFLPTFFTFVVKPRLVLKTTGFADPKERTV